MLADIMTQETQAPIVAANVGKIAVKYIPLESVTNLSADLQTCICVMQRHKHSCATDIQMCF